ncbi:MAG: Holliday junction branch migration protein RuvA [bacterium]
MISHLNGILEHIGKNYLVVEVANVGYHVNVPASTLARLPKLGGAIKLFTSQVVREDDISLYGFLSQEERSLFSLLLKVSGIGPKAAMSILAAFPLEKVVSAITSGDVNLLSTAPGIGKKTAQKLVIELREKVAKAYVVKPSDMIIGLEGSESTLVSDSISALIALGYTPREARETILKLGIDPGANLEEIVKGALKTLV